jgi:hypothetical protein
MDRKQARLPGTMPWPGKCCRTTFAATDLKGRLRVSGERSSPMRSCHALARLGLAAAFFAALLLTLGTAVTAIATDRTVLGELFSGSG